MKVNSTCWCWTCEWWKITRKTNTTGSAYCALKKGFKSYSDTCNKWTKDKQLNGTTK